MFSKLSGTKWKRSILISLLVIFIPLIAFGYYGIRTMKKENLIDEQRQKTNDIAFSIKYRIFEKLVGITKAIAQKQEILEQLNPTIKFDHKSTLTFLESVKTLLEASIVYILNVDGTVVACTPFDKNETLTGNNYRFRPYHLNAMKGEDVVYPALGVTTKERGLYFSSPIFIDAKINGVIVVKMNLKSIDNLMVGSDPVLLVSPEGIVFSSNQKEWMFHSVFSIEPLTKDRLRKSKQYADHELNSISVHLDKEEIYLDNTLYSVYKSPIVLQGWQLISLKKITIDYPLTNVQLKIIGMVFGIIAILSGFIVYLQINIIWRRKIEKELKIHEEKLIEYNENLEKTVVERTKDLQESLNEVSELKRQQDGDYFLTSLLLKPLMKNKNSSKQILTDYIIVQKKKFTYKNKNHDLGGDICITDNIILKGENYVFFFNGDAMGKSMQGAGGALVIGSVLNSILSFTESSSKNQDKTPEQWLEETFFEIQNILESFDGYMLVSGTLGIIHEATGMMHYFNSEHPYTILYRENKAGFIDSHISVHKLGMKMQSDFEMFQFQLNSGDTVIIGSDGKDDLSIGLNEDGMKIINENEFLFLDIIENTKCDIHKMYNEIQHKGEITDDFSILSIYFSKMNSIEHSSNQQMNEIFSRANQSIKLKKYNLALDLLTQLNNSNHILYYLYTALCYHKLNRNIEAIDLVQNANSSIQLDTRIMQLCANIHFELRQYDKSKQYLEKLLVIDPKNIGYIQSLDRIQKITIS